MAIWSSFKKAKLSRYLEGNLGKGYALDTSVLMCALMDRQNTPWELKQNQIIKWLQSDVMKTIYSENFNELILLNRYNLKRLEPLINNASLRLVSCEEWGHGNDYNKAVRDLRKELENYPIGKVDRTLIEHAEYEKLSILSFDRSLLQTAERCGVATCFPGGGMPYNSKHRGTWPRKVWAVAQ